MMDADELTRSLNISSSFDLGSRLIVSEPEWVLVRLLVCLLQTQFFLCALHVSHSRLVKTTVQNAPGSIPLVF